MNNGSNPIELSRDSEGQFSYTPGRPPQRPGQGLVIKVVGIAVGVALFLLMLFLFVYVVLPITLVLIAFFLLRKLFRSLLH